MPERVLVVEDDPQVREVVIAVVEKEGHTAVPAKSGDEALRLLRDGLHPCLILVDQMRAVAGGESFTKQQSADPEWSTIPTLEITPRGPDRLVLTWTSSDGTRTDTAELHRLR